MGNIDRVALKSSVNAGLKASFTVAIFDDALKLTAVYGR